MLIHTLRYIMCKEYLIRLGSGRLAYLLGGNWLLAGLVKFLNCLLVVTQILLTADKNDWETVAEMKDFGDPLLAEHVSAYSYLRTVRKGRKLSHTFSWTLSRESGESTAKQMRMTCESGYERGLRRS